MSTTKVDKTIAEEVQTAQAVVQLWLSSDTAKKDFVASPRLTGGMPVQPADVRKMKTKQFERTRTGVEEWIKWGESMLPEGAELCIIMESTGPYSLEMIAWAKLFRPAIKAVHVRAWMMKEFLAGIGLRNKTDKLDARGIAVFGSERRPDPPEPSSPEYKDLQALTRLRQSWVEQVTQVSNQHDTITSEHLSAATRKLLGRSNKAVLNSLQKQVQQIEKDITTLVNSHDNLKQQVQLLESIDGVAFLSAAVTLGELGDLTRFATCRQLTAFAGLNPVLNESADKQSKSRISKHGSPRARRALYMAGMAAVRYNEHLKKHYEDLLARGKSKMTALIAIMRQLLVLMRGVLKSKKAYDPNYKTSCGKTSSITQLKTV